MPSRSETPPVPRHGLGSVAYARQREREMAALCLGSRLTPGPGEVLPPKHPGPEERAEYRRKVAEFQNKLIDAEVAERQRLAEERSRPPTPEEQRQADAVAWWNSRNRVQSYDEREAFRRDILPLINKRARLVATGAPPQTVAQVEAELKAFDQLPPMLEGGL